MATERITEQPDLSPVLGELDEEQAERADREARRRADEQLAALADTLNERGGRRLLDRGRRAGDGSGRVRR